MKWLVRAQISTIDRASNKQEIFDDYTEVEADDGHQATMKAYDVLIAKYNKIANNSTTKFDTIVVMDWVRIDDMEVSG